MTSDLKRAEAALERLGKLHPKLIDLGLDRGLGLLSKLGNPHLKLPPVLHAAGTNGKGSTLAFIRSIIESSGRSIHGYASPHLVRFHERIRIAGDLISDQALADLLEEVEAINGDDPMTFFEITTAAAMLAFSRNNADAVLLETGLGGRADSTNVIPEPAVTIITPIAKDHEHFLGNTLAAIAGEKAGIMRKNVPCISAEQSPEALKALSDHATQIGVPFFVAGQDFTITPKGEGLHLTYGNRSVDIPKLGLRGRHQIDNAGLAIAAVITTFPDISDDALIHGAAHAQWPGRIQELRHGTLIEDDRTTVLLDGAHNAHGAEALANTLSQMSDKPWTLICGALNTRDPKDFLMPLRGCIGHAITLTIPDQEASLTNHELCQAAQDLGINAEPCSDIETAMEQAYVLAHRNQGNIIIAGSLYLAGHILMVNKTLPQ